MTVRRHRGTVSSDRHPPSPTVTENAKLRALLEAIVAKQDPDAVEGFGSADERYQMLKLAQAEGLIDVSFSEGGAAVSSSILPKGRAVLSGEIASPFARPDQVTVTDAEASRIVLRWFYDNRDELSAALSIPLKAEDFGGQFTTTQLVRYVKRLYQAGLVSAGWAEHGEDSQIYAKDITPEGIDAIEGTEQTSNMSQTINIHGGNVQIGNYNTQKVDTRLQAIVDAIQAADVDPEAKRGALERLRDFLSHPATGNVFQGAGVIAQALGGG